MKISGIPLRAVRAAYFTALVVMLAAASHVLLSGVPLPVTTVAPVAGAVFATAYVLAGRERSFRRIALLLVPLELAADTVFTTGQHLCYGPVGGPVAGPLRTVGFDVLCGDGASVHAGVAAPLTRVTEAEADHLATLLAEAHPGTAWLLLAVHVAVGLLAAAWLSRGERALARTVGAVAATTFRPLLLAVTSLSAAPTPAPRLSGRPTRRAAAARDRLLVHALGLRGPPCPAHAVAFG